MPYTLKPNKLFVKDPNGSGYLPQNVVTDKATEDVVAEVNAAGAAQIAALENMTTTVEQSIVSTIQTNEYVTRVAQQVNSMSAVTVTGTDPVITANPNTRYKCGEVATISFTPASTGICDVIFESGATPAVLTVPSTVKLPEWFASNSLEANTIYEISIADGVYGVVATWPKS